jgi:hypothetical protein
MKTPSLADVLDMMDQLEVEHNNALSRWNELRRYLKESAQQSAQADGACPECDGRGGYHKTGCKLWLCE